MFMQPIAIPAAATVAAPRRPTALKAAVGAGFGLGAVVAMPAWLAAVAAWIAVATCVRTAWQSALYAGEAIVGR